MSVPGIPANITRGWGGKPEAGRCGTPRIGVSAALWANDGKGVQEVWGDPEPGTHIVSVPQASFPVEVFKDGRRAFAKTVQAGTVQLMPAGVRPRAVHFGRWRILHLYVPTRLMHELIEQDGLATRPRSVELVDPECAHDRVIQRIGTEVMAELRGNAPLSALRVDALGQDLAIRLLRTHSNLAGAPRAAGAARGGLAAWQMRRVCDAMDAGLDRNLGLAALAGVVGLSPTHLSRAFKQTAGVPPFAWLLQRRIEQAKELLADPRVPLAEVALAVGFSAQPQFTTAFRRATGTTPGAWRRERAA